MATSEISHSEISKQWIENPLTLKLQHWNQLEGDGKMGYQEIVACQAMHFLWLKTVEYLLWISSPSFSSLNILRVLDL